MIQNKQLYAYIVNSLDILNKSLTVNEQNTVKLFSYLYNYQNNLNDKIISLNKNHVDLSLYKKTNQHIEDLEKCVISFDDKIKKLESKISKLEENINDKIIIEVPVIVQDNFNIFIRGWIFLENNIYKSFNYFKHLYNKIYQHLFKEKIKREQEEQERIYQEKLAEKKKQEIKERQKRINEILNKPRKR